MKNEIRCAIEFRADETRETPGRLAGVLLRYNEPAGDCLEVFASGALTWPTKGVLVREQHDRGRPIVLAVPFVDGDEVRIDAPLPNTTRARDVVENIRAGVYSGLSVEFHPTSEGRRGRLREIRSAILGGAGLVDRASYRGSTVEVRSRAESAVRRGWWYL